MFAGILTRYSCWRGAKALKTFQPDFIRIHADAVLRIFEHINTKEGVEWMTMEQICDDFKSKNDPPKGAWLPAEKDAVLSDPGQSAMTLLNAYPGSES